MADLATINAPIGVFDSGVGGLSVLQALKARLPNEHFIYVADSGYAPYGDQSTEFIERRATEVAHFLVRLQAKAMVIACNTASVNVAANLRKVLRIPVVAMEPAIKPASLATKSKVVLVLATTGTLRSQSVVQLCKTHGDGVRIILQPCSGLADQVERGDFCSAATRRLLHMYIRPGIAEGADTIVLGCTHYAFLAGEIASIAGPSVRLVEPSEAIARQLARVIVSPDVLSSPKVPETKFYTSGSTTQMSTFLTSIGEPFEQVLALPLGEA
ncbi:MAG: glutamate racemase [Candidatus Nitrotoga sp.]